MQFQHIVTAGSLMQSVNVLRDDSRQLSLALQLCQRTVRGIGAGTGIQHMPPVVGEKFLREPTQVRAAQHSLRRFFLRRRCRVQPGTAPEIRDAAPGRNPCPAQEDHTLCSRQNRGKLRILFFIAHSRSAPFPPLDRKPVSRQHSPAVRQYIRNVRKALTLRPQERTDILCRADKIRHHNGAHPRVMDGADAVE